jgi:hypothetical protein
MPALFSVRIVHASGMLHKPAYGSYNNCVYVSVYFCGQLLTNVAMFHQNRHNRTTAQATITRQDLRFPIWWFRWISSVMFCSSCQNVTKLVLYWLGSWNMYAPRFESYRLITGARIFLDMYSFNGSNVLILIASTYGDIVHFFHDELVVSR